MTIGPETLRVSNEAVALTNYWDPYVSSAGSIKWAASSEYGGWVKTTFSNFRVLPKTFENNWPAPAGIGLTLKYTDDTEGNAVTLFDGNAHTAGLDRESNDYELFGEEYTDTVTDEVIDDTLVDVFTTYTGASYLNLNLNTGSARNPSPAVKYTASGEQVLINVLSDIAKFFSHSFYISNGTLYLVDLLADNGSSSLTEFDFSPVQYRDPPPIRRITAGIYSVIGSYSYGDDIDITPVCHDTQSNIEDALDDIKTILESRGVELSRPISATEIPAIGEAISTFDESYDQDLTGNFRVHGLVYNFDNYQFVITGKGSLS